VRIAAWSNVPRQSGLGGSSLLVTLALAALRQFYDLDRHTHNDYILCELTQNVEAIELGITCGFADRYVPFFGGLAYLDYRGKLYQRPLGSEPFVTYERLDSYIERLPLVAITTGVQHNSGDVHGRMRPRYLQEYDLWNESGGAPPPLVRTMQSIYDTAWKGKIALLEGDLEEFGHLMNANHRLIDDMMTYCGFLDGAGWANNLFIQVALENKALGAKLTGAGGGGSVFALVHPGQEEQLVQAWQQAAEKAGLMDARIYQPRISTQGLLLEYLSGN
jgi:glucuronokinase